MNVFRKVVVAATLLALAPPVFAAELVRDAQLIVSMPLQGVRFDMTPKQAFDHLWSLGYRAGDIGSFEEWNTDGIEFVLGDFGSPDGISRVTMGRDGDSITSLSESWNRPRDHFSASQYIDEMRSHFNIAVGDKECHAVSDSSGVCRVQDAVDAHDVDLVYGLQVLPGMLLRHVDSRRAHAQ